MFAFLTTLLSIVMFAKSAPLLGLTDTPSARKQHEGAVPIVGGLAIYITLLSGTVLWGGTNTESLLAADYCTLTIFVGCAGFLVATGALDDRFNLGVASRVGAEVLVALVVIEALDLRVKYLGDLLGTGQFILGDFVAYPFTVIAIFGLINAFNMIDGMDGVLSSIVLTALIMFHLFTEIPPSFVSIMIGSSLLAFLVSNLALSSLIPKSFLGDAGSRLLGFIVVCLLLGAASSQIGKEKLIQPVTALFLVALPLFDMVFTTCRRLLRGNSPFLADRTHVHHLLHRLGFSDKRTLVIIVGGSVSLNFMGLILHRAGAAEYIQFVIFLSCFAFYCLLCTQAWKVATQIRAEDK